MVVFRKCEGEPRKARHESSPVESQVDRGRRTGQDWTHLQYQFNHVCNGSLVGGDCMTLIQPDHVDGSPRLTVPAYQPRRSVGANLRARRVFTGRTVE
jgi:hypothetical protein